MVLNDDNDESRRVVEQCYRTRKTLVNPIIDWGNDDVWEFLNEVAKVPHCKLYDHGYTRLGCIGCPMNSHAAEELERFPKYKAMYLRAFGRMLEQRKEKGLVFKTPKWEKPEDVYWWVYHDWQRKNKKEGHDETDL